MAENQNQQSIFNQELINSIKGYIIGVISLEKGVDKKATIAEIKNKKSMSGANAWMLMCSIVIASIGLSQNSQAVIIGAMLISPLMSPILGIGLGVGINDKSTLFNSLQHLGVAILITLITSTVYFYFTPFGEITAEIEARTEPTFLDIIIAIFGGVAGIVSIARKDISTTLPGVAIATALMPPLCVTGFGIAKGNWAIASTSFYLFFLNTFFVALSTYFVIKLLKFPLRKYLNREDRRRNLWTVSIISAAAIIPSLLIFKNVWEDVRQKQQARQFIDQYIGENNLYLDEYRIEDGDSSNFLILKVYGNKINESHIEEYNKGLEELGMKKTYIKIIPTSEVDLSDVTSLENKISGVEQIAARLEESSKAQKEQDIMIKKLSDRIVNSEIDSTIFKDVTDELRTIFPNIEEIGMAKIQKTNFGEYDKNLPLTLIKWDKKTPSNQLKSDEKKIEMFLRERLELDTMVVIRI